MLVFSAPWEHPIGAIDVLDRNREVTEARVQALAASIAEIGLMVPIDIRELDDENGTTALIAGAGRLAAMKRLGKTSIMCRMAKGSDFDAKMWEIDENLAGGNLTASERRSLTADRVKLVLARQKEEAKAAKVILTQHGSKLKEGRGRPKGGLRAAAREIGIPLSTAQRAVKLASVTPEATAAAVVAGISDNQAAMLRVADAPPEAQVAAVVQRTRASVVQKIDYRALLKKYIDHVHKHDGDELAASTVKFTAAEIAEIRKIEGEL